MPLELDQLPHNASPARTAKIPLKAADGTTYYATFGEFIALLNSADVGLGNVNNTADSAKPVSTAQQAALDLKADLVAGKIPASQLPGSTDDVQEFANLAGFPGTGTSNILYIAVDTNKAYRWTGSVYVPVGDGDLALGETSSTAYRGDRGKTAYDHSQLTSGNPHNVTKGDVGLGNADNTSDANKPVSTAQATAISLTASNAATANALKKDKKFETHSSAFAMVSGGRYGLNPGTGPFTATLPASPAADDEIELYDVLGDWGVNNVTIARNTKKIEGADEDLVLNTPAYVRLIYGGTAMGWRVFVTVSA